MRRTVGTLLIVFLSGCSYYVGDDDGTSDGGDGQPAADGGPGIVDGGVIGPDAAAPCDPMALLPTGFQPVAVVSSGAVTNQPDGVLPDVFTTTVDASAGGAAAQAGQAFIYLDLEAADGAAAVPIDDPTSFQSSDWDLALKRFVIRSNSGDSGPADGEVATVQSEELTFNDDVPSQLFADDDWSHGTSSDCTLVRDTQGGPSTRFSNWYQLASGRFEPKPLVHLVRLGGGRYAEVDIVTYYGDPADSTRSGVYVLHWRRFP